MACSLRAGGLSGSLRLQSLQKTASMWQHSDQRTNGQRRGRAGQRSNFTRSKEAHRIRRRAHLKGKCTTDNIMSTTENIKVGRSVQSLVPSSPHHSRCDQIFPFGMQSSPSSHSALLLKIMFRLVRERLLALYGPQNNRKPSPRGHPFSTATRAKVKSLPLQLIPNKIGSLP